MTRHDQTHMSEDDDDISTHPSIYLSIHHSTHRMRCALHLLLHSPMLLARKGNLYNHTWWMDCKRETMSEWMKSLEESKHNESLHHEKSNPYHSLEHTSLPSGCQWAWATGQYTNRCHRAINNNIGPYFMRSAKLPHIRAGVIIAKVSWYMQYTGSYCIQKTEAMIILMN